MSKFNPFLFFVNDTYLGEFGRHYRPLWRLSGWIQHKLSGDIWFNPTVTYTFIAAWFFLTGAGLFTCLWALGCSAISCFIGVLVFSLHPAIVEPVAWSAAESYLLAGMFGVWAATLTVYGLTRGKSGWIYWSFPVVLSWCAIISNELALGIPPLLIMVWHCLSNRSRSDWRNWVYPGMQVALVGLYLGLRVILFGALTNYKLGPSPAPVTPLVEHADFFKFLAGRLLWNYWPAWLDAQFSIVEPLTYLAATFAVMLLLLWRVAKKEIGSAFAVATVLCAAAYFTSHRLYPVEDEPVPPLMDAGRIVFLSVICLGLTAGVIVDAFRRKASRPTLRLMYCASAVVLIQFAINTRLNIRVWVKSSDIVKQFIKTLPQCMPQPPTDRTLVLKDFPNYVFETVVPGIYTNRVFTFQVATEFVVNYAYKKPGPEDLGLDIKVAINPTDPVDGPVIKVAKDGTAICN